MGGLNQTREGETWVLELSGGRRKEWCRGEMQREHEERRLRRKITKRELTLKNESVGIKQE